MRLVACQNCHAQYDVSKLAAANFHCGCGATVANRGAAGIDAKILRCGSCGAAVAEDAAHCAYCGSPIARDHRERNLICPECYARNTEGTRFCTACGVAFRPRRIPTAGSELACPACGEDMAAQQIGDIGVYECPDCEGIWVPRENFEILVNRAIDAYQQRIAAPRLYQQARVAGGTVILRGIVYRHCPDCGKMMSRENFRKRSGVIIDRCYAHGTWLDADELERIAGFIMNGGKRSRHAVRTTAVDSAHVPGAVPVRAEARPSQRTRALLAARKVDKACNPGLETATTVLGFLGRLLTTEF